jgi:hypothetical protein
LQIWLKETPAYTVVFAQLVLINCLVDSVADSTICPALATGKIKKFYIITGSLYILTLPIAYVFLNFGFDPTITMIVSIGISMISVIVRAILLGELIRFPIWNYILLYVKLLLVTVIIGVCTHFSLAMSDSPWVVLILSTLFSSILHSLLYLLFVCSVRDREQIIGIVRKKIKILMCKI